MKYPRPKDFKPTESEVKEALNKVANFFSPDKQISSSNFPDLKVRGNRNSNS